MRPRHGRMLTMVAVLFLLVGCTQQEADREDDQLTHPVTTRDLRDLAYIVVPPSTEQLRGATFQHRDYSLSASFTFAPDDLDEFRRKSKIGELKKGFNPFDRPHTGQEDWRFSSRDAVAGYQAWYKGVHRIVVVDRISRNKWKAFVEAATI